MIMCIMENKNNNVNSDSSYKEVVDGCCQKNRIITGSGQSASKASHHVFAVIIGSDLYLCSSIKWLCIQTSPAMEWEVTPVAPGIYQTLRLVIFHHAVFNSIQNVLIQRRGETLCLDTSSESLVSEHHGARPWPIPGAAQMACLF